MWYLQPHPADCGPLCEESDGFHGLLLSKERPQARFTVIVEPAGKQFPGDVSRPDIGFGTPRANAVAEVVDEIHWHKIARDSELAGS